MWLNDIFYKDKVWEQELSLYKALKNWDENDSLVIAFVDTVKKAIWELVVWTVSCMDDRLSIVDWSIRIAWSWNLLLDSIWQDWLIEIFKKLWVKKITTHNDCWAAGVYATSNNLDWDPDEITQELIKEISNSYNLKHEHISNIDIPHWARSIFVDTTARFNPSKVDWLPEAFVVTAKEFPVNHVIEQINIAIDIATWNHWFWEKIDKNNPFFIFIIWNKWINEELEEKIEKVKQERWDILEIRYI